MVSKDYPVLLFLALAPLLFLCGTLTSGQSFFMRDLTYLFHPWRALSSQMIQGGEIPLWNPYAMGGMPFLANCQSSILYPFTLFFTHFHFSLALKLFHFFHYFLASLGFFLLARKLEFSRWIACAGAILFAYNGYLLTRFEFLSVLGGVIWFPWILLCFSVHPFPAVLTLSISFFAGFPQIFILQSGAALFYWLYREQSKENVWKIAKTFFIFLCLIGLHWIPTWELLLNSSRGAGGIPWEEAASYSFPPDGLLGLISPFRILHHPDRFTGEKYFWIWSAWWGIAATFLAFCALASKNKKLLTYSLILGIMGLLWSLGKYLPLYPFFYKHVPLVSLFRYPPVALYWTLLSVSFLTILGLTWIEGCCNMSSFPRKRESSCENSSLDSRFRGNDGTNASFTTNLIRNGFSLCAVALLTLELWHYGKNIHPTVPSQYYHKRFPAIQTVIQDNPGNVLISEPVNQQRRLAGMDSQEAMMRFRGFFFDLTNLPYRVQSLVPSGEPFTLRSYENLYKKMKEFRTVQDARPLLNFWNVTHFLSYAPLDSSWNLMGQDQELKIYQNPQASGKAFAMVGDRFENSATPQIFKPSFLLWNHQKIKAQFNSSQPMVAVFNLPFYPGWHLFCSCGSQHPSQPLGGYFRSVSIPEGNHTLYLKYHPLSWNLSLVLSLLVFIFLIVAGLKILQNSKRHVRSIS